MPNTAIDHVFAFHPATETTGPLHDQVRALLRQTAHRLVEITPDGELQDEAIDHLRHAMYSANAAIACDHPATATADARPAPEQDAERPRHQRTFGEAYDAATRKIRGE